MGMAQNAEDATDTLVTDLLNRITTEKTSLLNRLSDPSNTHLSDSEDYLNDQVSSASSEINTNFDAAKKNISEEIEAGKSNALAQSLLYADELQVELDVEMQNRIHDEREQITSNIGNTEVNLSLKLQELDSQNTDNLDAAGTEIDEKLDERFSSLNDVISNQNQTNVEKVKSVEEDLCEKIKFTTEQTRQISMFTKNEIKMKLKQMIDAVKFELEHSRKQIELFKA